MKKRAEGVGEYVKSYDVYGQPISLHYEGEDTYKTCPGGLISMVILFIIYVYALVKGKQMMVREEWSLVRQEVVSSYDELQRAHNFNESEYSNISLALQFYTRKEKQTAALKK